MALSVFIPSRDERFYLLKAHRQPLPENLAREYITRFTRPGDLVIDPFAASDAIPRVAVELGRRVIAVDSNPIVAFAARVEATLPPAPAIESALARLGQARKGETLKALLEKLYLTHCADCESEVVADLFVYRSDQEKKLPVEKIYICPNCGWKRSPTTVTDREQAEQIEARGLHYHLLVQKLAGDDARHGALVRRQLEYYTPRNLYALSVVTQKLDAEFRDDPARAVLAALVLHALDVGSSVYSAPDALPEREPPPEFVEFNIWRTLEAAAQGLAKHSHALRLAARAADVARATVPAVFIGHGGAHGLAEAIPSADAALLLSSPARLDPSFWELSFLWTRWLFGSAAGVSLEPLLEDKRQRWGWYGEALAHTLEDCARITRDGGRVVFAFPSNSHAMIEALLLAAAREFALEEFCFRPRRGALDSTEFGALPGDYRVVLSRRSSVSPEVSFQQAATRIRQESLLGALDALNARSEPLAYSWLHHGALERLARQGVLAETRTAKLRPTDNVFQFLRHRMDEGMKEGYAHDLDHWVEKGRVLWLRRELPPGARPLAERVEEQVRALLSDRGIMTVDELEDELLSRFTGIETPEIELVELCAEAYADKRGDEWVWRTEDVKAHLAYARTLLSTLGKKLGFQVVEDAAPFDSVWQTEKVIPGSSSGHIPESRTLEPVYAFVLRVRVDLAEFANWRSAPLRGLIVIPESKVALTKERFRRDPPLQRRLARAGWDFLRIPFVEALAAEQWTVAPEFQLAVGLDPALARDKEQLELF